MTTAEERLGALGITLPPPPQAVANYVPHLIVLDHLVIVSGQLPFKDGALAFRGKIGADLDLDAGRQAARLCAINLLAQLQGAVGGLDRLRRVVRLGGFVNCVDSFQDQPAVINAASDLMVDVFGEAGRHARTAVGVNALPLGAPVEIDGMFEVD